MKIVFLFSFIFLFRPLFAAEVLLTEEGLMNLVMEKNNLVQASIKETESFKYKTDFWQRSFIPKLSLVYAQESFKYVVDKYRNQPYLGAELELNLYNGGRDRLEGQIRKAEFNKASASQKVILFSQLEEARRIFWNMVYIKNHIDLNTKTLTLVTQNKAKAIRRIRAGLATESDKIIFEIKEEELRQEQARNKLDFDKEQQTLKVILGLKNDDQVKVSQNLIHDHSWENVLKHSEDSHNYLLQPAQYGVQASSLKAEQVQSQWLPKVDAYAMFIQNNQRMDFERTDEEDRRQTILGVRFSWNLDNFLQLSKDQSSAVALSKAQEMRLNFDKQVLTSKLHMEIKELKVLDGLVHGAEENIKKADKLYRLVQKEYERGVKNSEDMLMATEKLINTEMKKNQIIKDFHYARIHIMTKLAE